MAEGYEEGDDLDEAERGGEVERGVGEAEGSVVGVVQELRVGVEDAADEEWIIVVDCAAEA